MSLDYNILNILILFGSIQGFILCFNLYQKRRANILATRFFLLFLFSLSFFNLIYALLDMNLFQYYRPLHMFPYPYKWLIGVGFYFYIKNQFPRLEGDISYHKKEWYLLLPAVVYCLLRTYWFSIAVHENSYRITQVVVESNFFTIHEFFYLFFTLLMGIASLRFLQKNKENILEKHLPNLNWLKKFSWVFIAITFVQILLYSFDLLIHNGDETFGFYYANLIINGTFIYWIGFVGFTKSKLFFNQIKFTSKLSKSETVMLDKLTQVIEEQKIYLNPNLTLSEFSKTAGVSPKDLSKYLNDSLNMNFSEYMNYYRVEEVKKLMATPEASKYTLVTLAERAGFNSKSSFNAIFKKVTGMTPSSYKKNISNP
ncbi:helix-turn-helix domain-containing protein [Pseudotenacibaculum haliotis]|uniref:Helix-turn-helix domain-containing protein n=1 Tax=Pseudotenacibaculum haliotis TaxID=1862138 RepID=A0ABW5LSB9_9FLAO